MCELHLTSLNVCKVHAKGNTLPRFLETFPVSVASTSRFLWFCFSLLFLLPLFQPIRFKADWTLINLVWFNDTWEKSSWSLAIPSSHKFKQSAYQCKREYHQVFQEFHLGMLSKPLVVSHFLVRYLFPCWSDLHTNCLEAWRKFGVFEITKATNLIYFLANTIWGRLMESEAPHYETIHWKRKTTIRFLYRCWQWGRTYITMYKGPLRAQSQVQT